MVKCFCASAARVHTSRAPSNERAGGADAPLQVRDTAGSHCVALFGSSDFLSGFKCWTESGEVSGSLGSTTHRCVLATELSISFARDRQLTPTSRFEMHSSLNPAETPRHLGHVERV